jgi:hypothetical protein
MCILLQTQQLPIAQHLCTHSMHNFLCQNSILSWQSATPCAAGFDDMLVGTHQSWCSQRQRVKGQLHYQPSNNQLDALGDILCDQGQHALALESVMPQGSSSQHAAAAAAAIFKSAEATKATLQASVVRTCLQLCAGSDREGIMSTGLKVICVALLCVVQSII